MCPSKLHRSKKNKENNSPQTSNLNKPHCFRPQHFVLVSTPARIANVPGLDDPGTGRSFTRRPKIGSSDAYFLLDPKVATLFFPFPATVLVRSSVVSWRESIIIIIT